MQIRHPRRLFLPALSIVAVVILLLALISISTYQNLDRDKEKAMAFIHDYSMALIYSLEAAVRAGSMAGQIHEDPMGTLIQEVGKIEDVAHICLIDPQGNIIHHSGFSPENKSHVWDWPKPSDFGKEKTIYRIRKFPGDRRVYELAKQFSPFESSPDLHPDKNKKKDGAFLQTKKDAIIIVGMNMKSIEQARRADLHHAIIMAGIVLALGTGALFFIFVIQNYYLVNKTLKQTQDYTRVVVDHMANGLLGIDKGGNVVSFNRLALELLELDASDIFGTNLNQIIDFQSSGIEDTLTESFVVLEREIEHSLKSGEKLPIAISVTPILEENGTSAGAVIVLRDLREIKRLENKVRRTEKLAAIGKLAAGVAHEIRNPLSSIKGFAQLLRQVLENHPDEKKYADIMVKEVDRINSVVTDLITFARPFEADLMTADITKLIEHAILLVQADADARSITLLKKFPLKPADVPLDVSQMTTAIFNLVLNAVQMMESGGRIELGFELAVQDSRLNIWVEDDGPGIPIEQHKKIFEPFYSTREKGTGLGLAIVHKIIENHNGEISIESPAPGRPGGCRFSIQIPVEPSQPLGKGK